VVFGKRKISSVEQFDDEKPEPFEPIFLYETGTVRMEEGYFFDAFNESIFRWIVDSSASYRVLGHNFETLYKTNSNKWIKVEYDSCHLESVQGVELWCSDGIPYAIEVEPLDAARFLLEHQCALPNDLKQVYSAHFNKSQKSRNAKIRPFQHWLDIDKPSMLTNTKFHNVDLASEFNLICINLYKISRMIEGSRGKGDYGGFFEIVIPLMVLNRSFPVDFATWDWSTKKAPPESIELLEMDWPFELNNIRDAINEFLDKYSGPLYCLSACSGSIDSPDKPTAQEMNLAAKYLYDELADIQSYATDVNIALREWIKQQEVIETPSALIDIPESETANNPETPIVTPEDRVPTHPENIPVFERSNDGIPILRFTDSGFYYDGKFACLTEKTIELFLYMARSPGGKIYRDQAASDVWKEEPAADGTVTNEIYIIRKALRPMLFLNEDGDPIPKKGRKKTLCWTIGFQFELIDEYGPGKSQSKTNKSGKDSK